MDLSLDLSRTPQGYQETERIDANPIEKTYNDRIA